jgi:hypothetical protein
LAIFEKNKNMKRIIFLSFIIFISSVAKSQVFHLENKLLQNPKLNIVYIGYDNEIVIVADSSKIFSNKLEELELKCKNCRSFTKIKNSYYLYVSNTKIDTVIIEVIRIKDTVLISNIKYAVKDDPFPQVQFGNLSEKNVTKEEFLKQNELIFNPSKIRENTVEKINFYKINGIKDQKIVFTFMINNNKISIEQKNIIRNTIKSGFIVKCFYYLGNYNEDYGIILNSIEYYIK